MEDRDLHGLIQLFLDLKTFRCPDIFEVDAPECRLEDLTSADDFLRILGSELDIEYVDVGEALEENTLAFHDRLSGESAYVPKSQHRCSITYYCDEVCFGRVPIGQSGIALDFLAGDSHAGTISEAKLPLRPAGFGGDHSHLAGRGRGVILQSVFGMDLHVGTFK
jgi:hypothetical protein